MADEDETQRVEEVSVAVVGQAAKLWTELKDNHSSLKPRGSSAPCTSLVETTIEGLKTAEKCDNPHELQENSSLQLQREYVDSTTSPEPPINSSELLLQKIEILENVSITSPTEDPMNSSTTPSSHPIPAAESLSIGSSKQRVESKKSTNSSAPQRVKLRKSTGSNAKESVETRKSTDSKKSEDDSLKDVVTELRTPNPVKRHSEWVSGDSAWTRQDNLQKVKLKQMHRSEVAIRIRERQLERKASVGPCCVNRNAREQTSGISISVPKKSAMDISTTHLGDQSKQDKELLRTPSFLTHTPFPTESSTVPTTHASDRAKELNYDTEEAQCSKQNKDLFSSFCGKMNIMCNKIKTMF